MKKHMLLKTGEVPAGPLIEGLPAKMFIHRRVKVRGLFGKTHGIPCVVHQVAGFKIVVRPDNHGQDETTTVDAITPWWGKNPDLKAIHDELMAKKRADREAENRRILELESPMEDPDLSGLTIVVRPGATIRKFAGELQAFLQAASDEEEATQMLRDATAQRVELEERLRKAGITVTRGMRFAADPAPPAGETLIAPAQEEPAPPKKTGRGPSAASVDSIGLLFTRLHERSEPVAVGEIRQMAGLRTTISAGALADRLTTRFNDLFPVFHGKTVRHFRQGRAELLEVVDHREELAED